ncbi:MAG: metallophosphatase family protein [Lachnospiraceae bacterium]|nr:metallophosphatase family protein [Lachnospiraceae bacterium]
MRIAVISDTHDILREEVLGQIRMADAVIHAGDVSSPALVNQIKSNLRNGAGFYPVRGNADGDWAEKIPETLELTHGQARIFVVHNRKKAVIPDGCDIVISGHTHRFQEEVIGGQLWLNPGSCGRRRFRQEVSMAVLHIEGQTRRVEKIIIESPGQSQRAGKSDALGAVADPGSREERTNPLDLSSGELLCLIKGILAGMKRGRTIAQIAGEMQLEDSFVEEICRIYVTHPGVSPNGILDKLEVNRKIGA